MTALLPDHVQAAPAPLAGSPIDGGKRRNPAHLLRGGLRPLARFADAVIAVLLALVTGTLHAVGVLGYPALGDDEGTYAAQAAAVRGGELTHYTYWYDHPPLGWIQIALFDWIPRQLMPGAQPVAASRAALVGAAAVSAVLAYLVGRRLGLRRAFAAAAVLLGFGSPLAIILQRQVYLDNIAVPWVLLALYLALDPARRLAAQLGAGAALAVAVLSKETTAVLVPVVLWTLWRRADLRLRGFALAAAVTGLGLVTLYPLSALMRGELLPGGGHVSLWDAAAFQLSRRPGSGPVWEAGSAARGIVDSWLYYDPWLIVLGLAALPIVLAARRTRPLGLALAVVVLVGLKPGGYLPAMYVVVALPLLGLSAAAAVDLAWSGAGRLLGAVAGRLPGRGGGARVGAAARRTAGAAGALVVLLGAVPLGAAWAAPLRTAMTTDANAPRVEAESWVRAHVARSSTLLVDDVTWVALAEARTVPRKRLVWFYKLDTDPAVRAQLPGGWRDVDYVVVTPEMRAAVGGNPALVQAAGALENSVLVAAFGQGDARIEIREVTA